MVHTQSHLHQHSGQASRHHMALMHHCPSQPDQQHKRCSSSNQHQSTDRPPCNPRTSSPGWNRCPPCRSHMSRMRSSVQPSTTPPGTLDTASTHYYPRRRCQQRTVCTITVLAPTVCLHRIEHTVSLGWHQYPLCLPYTPYTGRHLSKMSLHRIRGIRVWTIRLDTGPQRGCC